MQTLRVAFLPDLIAADSLTGRSVVIIDVLRASTTIVRALASGASAIVPCLEIADAERLVQREPGCLLGGERGGLRIDGFDLGNSPAEYTPQVVKGSVIGFTTTNGTRAMQHCQSADRLFIAAFTNLSTVCREIESNAGIDIVCAGTHGSITREDVLLAGAMVDRLMRGNPHLDVDDSARLARDAWNTARTDKRGLADVLADSHGGHNLQAIGQAEDIALAADLDRETCIPELDPMTGRITRRV